MNKNATAEKPHWNPWKGSPTKDAYQKRKE